MAALFTFSNLRISPYPTVVSGEEMIITVAMKNVGDVAGSQNVSLSGWWGKTRLAALSPTNCPWSGSLPCVPWVLPGQTVDVSFTNVPEACPAQDCEVTVSGSLATNSLTDAVDVACTGNGGAAEFVLSNLRVNGSSNPAPVRVLELMTIEVDVANTGEVAGQTTVTLSGWWTKPPVTTSVIPAGGMVTVRWDNYPESDCQGAGCPDCSVIVDGLTVYVDVLGTGQVYGTITVDANLPAVDVYVDGALEGNTALGPLVVTREPGPYDVGFGPKVGYDPPLTREVIVVANQNVDTYGTYTPISDETGFLLVTTTPAGATVFVNGVEAGTTQPGFALELELEEDTYTISFGPVEGYTTPGDETVVITGGGTKSLNITYQPSGTAGKPWLIPAAVGLGVVGLVLISQMKKR